MRKLALAALMLLSTWPLPGQEVITARRRAAGGGTNVYTINQHAPADLVSGLSCAVLSCTITNLSSTTIGQSLIVCVEWGDDTNTITGAVDNASVPNVFTVRGSPAVNTGQARVQCLDSLNITHGSSTNIVITFSALPSFVATGFWNVSSTSAAVFDSVQNGNNLVGVGNTVTGQSITTTGKGFIAAGFLVFDFVTANPAAGNAFTSGGDLNQGGATNSLITTAGGTYASAVTDNTSGDSAVNATAAYK